MNALITNTNTKTGLPFGVISGKSLDIEILEDILYAADIVAFERAREEFALELAEKVGPNSAEYDAELEKFGECWSCDEPEADIEVWGYHLHVSFLGGAPIIFSYDGPTQKVAAYCSPCVPGAADLDSGVGTIECHGIPATWLAEVDL